MFKKRAPPSKKPYATGNTINNTNDDDDDDLASSPTITVSVPHDVFDQTTTTATTSTTSTSGRAEERQWTRTTTTTTSSSSRRSSYERSPFLPQHQQQQQQQQGVKAWNPQQQQQSVESGSGLGMTAGAGMVAGGTESAGTGIGTGTGTSSPSLSTPSSSSSPPSSSKTKSPAGMMLNLTGMFSATNSSAINSTANGTTTSTTSGGSGALPQPMTGAATAVEAQLWNADWVEPASPALPRYIPAITGKGLGIGMGAGSPNPRTGGGSGGRLNAGWGSGGGSAGMMGRKSGEGAGWKTASATAAGSPSFDRRSSESAAQAFKSRVAVSAGGAAGYIPNGSTNGHSMPPQQQHQQHQQPIVSPALRRSQPLQQRTGGDGTGTGSGGGSLEMSWINSDGRQGYDDNDRNHDDDVDEEDYYKDRRKDRSYYTRREHGHRQQKSHFPLLFSDPKRVLRARLFCLRQNRRLHPCIRLIVFLFLAGSVCFTTVHLLFLGAGRPDGLGKVGELRKSFDLTEQQLRVRKMLGRPKEPERALSSFDVEAQNYSIHQWAVDTYDIRNSKSSLVPFTLCGSPRYDSIR